MHNSIISMLYLIFYWYIFTWSHLPSSYSIYFHYFHIHNFLPVMTMSTNCHSIINTSAEYFTYVQVIIFRALFFFFLPTINHVHTVTIQNGKGYASTNFCIGHMANQRLALRFHQAAVASVHLSQKPHPTSGWKRFRCAGWVACACDLMSATIQVWQEWRDSPNHPGHCSTWAKCMCACVCVLSSLDPG